MKMSKEYLAAYIEEKRHYKVLFVEDEPAILQQTSEWLIKIFDMVYVASDGKEAMDIINKTKVDIVICDLHMPVMSGVELITQIRDRFKILPIVITTGYPEFESIYSNIENIKLITKPYNAVTILEAISEIEADNIDCGSCNKCLVEKIKKATKEAKLVLDLIVSTVKE